MRPEEQGTAIAAHGKRCDCISLIRSKLTALHGAEVSLDLKQMINTETLSLITALPPLTYSYMEGKKRRKSYIVFNYCPFCGRNAST